MSANFSVAPQDCCKRSYHKVMSGISNMNHKAAPQPSAKSVKGAAARQQL